MTTTPAPIFIVTYSERDDEGFVTVNDALASNCYFTTKESAQDFADRQNAEAPKNVTYAALEMSPMPVAP